MFNVIPNPTFSSTLTVTGQGREQKLPLVYKHKTTDEFDALMTKLSAGEVTPVEAVQELVESWEADLPFCEDSLQKLQAHQPGCLSAIIADYSTAFLVSRKGN